MARKRRQELKDNSFINIQGWMARLTTKAGRVLSMPELIIFANIFGFSQDGKSRYMGGISYLMEFLHLSKPTVLAHLSTLENEGLIGRFEYENGDVDYFAISKDSLPVKNLNRLNNFTGNGKEILPESDSDLYIYNKNNNKDSAPADAAACAGTAAAIFVDLEESSDNIPEKENATPLPPSAAAPRAASKARAEKKAPAFDFRGALIGLGINEDLAIDWMQARKKGGAINSERAFKEIAKEIEKAGAAGYTPNDCIHRCVNGSTIGGKPWIGFKAEWMRETRFNNAAPAYNPAPARHKGPVAFND